MKTISIFAFALFLTSRAATGQVFDEETRLINVGIGFGNRSYYRSNYSSYTQSPAFSLSYEQSMKEKIGPGIFGLGGYVGYQKATYRSYYYNYYYYSQNYYYEDAYKYYLLAGRAVYHWDVLNKDKAELYSGLILGLRIQTSTHTDSDPNHPYNYYYNQGSSGFIYAGFIGGRYYLTKHAALYCEIGYGISYANIGLTLKL